MTDLAIDGGDPVRNETLPYGGQSIDEADKEAVLEVLDSDWLTTGPKVDTFEEALCEEVSADHGVAVSNGTAALHTALHVAGVGEGDEVVVPPMTFASTANVALYEDARPVFADVDPSTLLVDPERVKERITPRTEAVVTVDYAGQPSRYEALQEICTDHDLILVADACHAPGASYRDEPVGSLAELTCFSFHPVKHITTGEGGMVVTDRKDWAEHGRRFRHQAAVYEGPDPAEDGPWAYAIPDLGRNYRITDIQCALGISQLEKLGRFVERRREIAARYDEALSDIPGIEPLKVRDDANHSYHLYVVRIDEDMLGADRDWVFEALHAEGIGVQVHYIPVHLHPLYRERLGTKEEMYPVAEQAYEEIVSLPVFPTMSDDDIHDVTNSVSKVAKGVDP